MFRNPTRQLTRKPYVLRGIAPSIAALTVLIALAALMPGASQTGKAHAAPSRNARRHSAAGPMDMGNPLFLPEVTYAAGGYFSLSIAIADVNGDGRPDIISSNSCLSQNNCPNGGGGVGVLLGNGDGTFKTGVGYSSGGTQAVSVAVEDLNGDGKPDLVVANLCNSGTCGDLVKEGSVGVLLGNGDGTFQAVVTYGSGGNNTASVGVGDVNGDGIPDIVVANQCDLSGSCTQGTVRVLLGKGDGTFQAATPRNVRNPRSMAVADVNGDGKLDLLLPNGVGVSVLLGNGDGTFQAEKLYGCCNGNFNSVAVADVNGDGKADLAVTNAGGPDVDGSVGVLLGNGDGTFRPVVAYDSGEPGARFAAIADVNGDGRPDLIVANTGFNQMPGSVGVLLGNGDGTFQPAVVFDVGIAYFVAAADLNGDGRPDLVVSDSNAGVMLNNTGPHSSTTTTLVSSANPAPPNQLVTYTATLTSQSGGVVTGTVIFKDGGVTVATVKLASNQATYSASYLSAAAHAITAAYSGDLHNTGSTSNTLTEYIGKFPVASLTVLSTSGSPSFVGQPVTFTAAVTPKAAKFGAIPDGEMVTFYDGTAAIGTGATASGVATFTTSSLTAKTHTVKATYSGDAIFKPSTGAVTQVVEKYSTTTTLTSNPNPSNLGQAVTFTAQVTSTGPSAPTGTVKFLDGSTSLGSAKVSGGVAHLTKSTLAAGTHPITAQYQGDAASAKSTSSVLNQVVQ